MFVDTHAHLTDERYQNVNEIIANFENDEIDFVITVGCDLLSSQKAVEIANAYENVYATVGVHPHDAKTYNDEVEQTLVNLSKHNKVVAFGEIGLDYFYDLSERKVQKQIFARQIKLADRLGLPIILHIRDAYQDAYDILKENKTFINNGGILHCYSGSVEMLERFSEFDFYVSFAGPITFKGNKKAEEVILSVSKNRILTETDCPYLTPQQFRGKTNYPKYVKYVAEKIAQVYAISVEELNETVKQNSLAVFKNIKR